jgi:hypothetical protein
MFGRFLSVKFPFEVSRPLMFIYVEFPFEVSRPLKMVDISCSSKTI